MNYFSSIHSAARHFAQGHFSVVADVIGIASGKPTRLRKKRAERGLKERRPEVDWRRQQEEHRAALQKTIREALLPTPPVGAEAVSLQEQVPEVLISETFKGMPVKPTYELELLMLNSHI